MVEDVLTSSERGRIDNGQAQEVFQKFQSIQNKEKILEECGMRKRSKTSLRYNSGTTAGDRQREFCAKDNTKISKNIKMLQSILANSQDDNNFGIDIVNTTSNGEFKKSNLNNFISFNNGETMFVGPLEENRKGSLPCQKLKSIKNKGNFTFNGSSFFSKQSKDSVSAASDPKSTSILNNIDFIKNIQKETGISFKDICAINEMTKDDTEPQDSKLSALQKLTEKMKKAGNGYKSDSRGDETESLVTDSSSRLQSKGLKDKLAQLKDENKESRQKFDLDENSSVVQNTNNIIQITDLEYQQSINHSFADLQGNHFDSKGSSIFKSNLKYGSNDNPDTFREEISIQGLDGHCTLNTHNTLSSQHPPQSKKKKNSQLRENIEYDTQTDMSQFTSRDGLKEIDIKGKGVSDILNAIQRKQIILNETLE